MTVCISYYQWSKLPIKYRSLSVKVFYRFKTILIFLIIKKNKISPQTPQKSQNYMFFKDKTFTLLI